MRTKTLLRLFVVIAIVALALPSAPVADAAPTSDILTSYFDCAGNFVGEKFRGCDSTSSNWGELSGAYKEIESCQCEGTDCTFTWYAWNGTAWVVIPGEPSPSC
jgi:hypothetical protein